MQSLKGQNFNCTKTVMHALSNQTREEEDKLLAIRHTSGSMDSFVVSHIIDRANATLFFIPPDSSEGNRSSTP